jgi:hypothetical protein
VAVKIHIGEWNRTRCLRPELVAAMYEFVVYEPPLTREHVAKWQIRTCLSPA